MQFTFVNTQTNYLAFNIGAGLGIADSYGYIFVLGCLKKSPDVAFKTNPTVYFSLSFKAQHVINVWQAAMEEAQLVPHPPVAATVKFLKIHTKATLQSSSAGCHNTPTTGYNYQLASLRNSGLTNFIAVWQGSKGYFHTSLISIVA